MNEPKNIDSRIGTLLLQSGKIKAEDADKILQEQVRSNLRFGDAAIKLGLIKQSDVEEILSQQFHFPYMKKSDKKVDPSLISAYIPYSNEVDKIRSLRGQLGVRWFNENKSLLVISTKSGTGNSVLSANLAVSYAQLGKKTLLVDANMRNPSIHSLFKVANGKGLSDMLASRTDSAPLVNVEEIDNLTLLTAGANPPNPVELLSSAALSNLNGLFEEQFDVVIYDTSAYREYGDAQAMMGAVKGLLLVARKNVTHMEDVKTLKLDASVNNAVIVGSALSEF